MLTSNPNQTISIFDVCLCMCTEQILDNEMVFNNFVYAFRIRYIRLWLRFPIQITNVLLSLLIK